MLPGGAAEIGQAGVDAHASPGTNEEGIGGEDAYVEKLAAILATSGRPA